MASASVCGSVSPLPFPSIFNTKPPNSLHIHNSSLPFIPLLALPTTTPRKKTINFHHPPHAIPQKSTQLWRISAVSEDALPSEVTPLENSQQIVSTSDEGVSTIISALLFVAFVALTILTIGVIYIAVTDFLQKREKEKFEKEESAKKKNGKKRKVRARAGPRGFGQKIDEENGDD
ncbi:uncharacterized protein LOC117916501 [Vitis riparia]|uniref:uncharacterized protein LOC117916501 n=1 Tax=Vitis riparia TaxID=96939 RepID=UPI00155B053C|nr:uncharacterized protein LOC117916501 [Vitis riparia]